MSEPEYLTVPEVAELLRLKERKVYDLAASGAIPCSRATGKLLFPAGGVRAWVAGATGGAVGAPPPPIVLGSHDPLLDWAIRESGSGLASIYDGSSDGLARFARGEGMLAGLHVPEPDGTWNVSAARGAAEGRNAALLGFARRSRGLLFRADGPRPDGLADLARVRFVPRQAGAGSQILLMRLAEAEGLDAAAFGGAAPARTEDDAAAAVGRGEADAAFGLEAVARAHGLRFLPVAEERFALLVDRAAFFEPPLRRLFGFVGSEAFLKRATALGGYDLSDLAGVLWNA